MTYNDSKPDFYAVLDLPRDADETEIRSAFRQLSLKYHPDRQGSSSVASHENFLQLTEAYETLRDPTRRRKYDMQLPPKTKRKPKAQQKSTVQARAQENWNRSPQ
ncbi:hypothetical protein M434DRAFT_10844 [Hypoxylon sp. CO27-5]|nr:hypothetical protein M434DRAFT_10844 [Hypoxylon sp. CO27-5]